MFTGSECCRATLADYGVYPSSLHRLWRIVSRVKIKLRDSVELHTDGTIDMFVILNIS